MRPRTNAHKHTPTHIHARRCSLSCKRSTTGSGWRGRTDALPSTTKSWASAGHLTPRQGQTSAPSPTPSPPCSPPGATSPSPSRYVSCLPLSLTQCFVRARVQMFRSRRLFVSATKMVLHLPPLLFPIAPDHSTVSDSIWLSLFLVCVQDVDGEATLVEIGPTPEPYVPLTTPQPSAESWPSQQSTTQDGYTRVISGPGLVQVRAHWGFGTIFFFFLPLGRSVRMRGSARIVSVVFDAPSVHYAALCFPSRRIHSHAPTRLSTRSLRRPHDPTRKRATTAATCPLRRQTRARDTTSLRKCPRPICVTLGFSPS